MGHQCKCAKQLARAIFEFLETRYCLSTFDITGVQAAALDQPQTHVLFKRTPTSDPLAASDGFGGTTFDVTAFLDTGTSATLLSRETAQGLGIQSATSAGVPVTYSDVGVGGNENFDVSEPLYSQLAPFFPTVGTDNLPTFDTVYNQRYGPIRTEISQTPADALIGPLDIIGMPYLQGKVMVMDPVPTNNLENMTTFVYNPGTPYNAAARATNPGIPTTNRHVKLSYGDFARFTLVTPGGAAGPNLNGNPFIGPDPTQALLANPKVDNTPPVSLSMGNLSSTGSFLFDTGAAASFISTAEAGKVGIHYKPGTYNSAAPDLVDANGVDVPNQFVIPLGGVGGTLNAAGFFLDSLTLPTVEGQGVRFVHAPVLVADITARDPVTGQSLTLDGDFGMNFLVASADISTGFPTNVTGGAFNWVTFDQPNGLLGLDIPGAPALSPVVSNVVFNNDQLPQKLTFTFSKNVSGVSVSSLLITNAATGTLVAPSSVTYDPTTMTATATFNTAGMLQGRYTATLLSSAITDSSGAHLDGAVGGTGGSNFVFSFSQLPGDANQDGVVNAADVTQIMLHGKYRTSQPATWADGDFNYDGKVDAKDMAMLVMSIQAGYGAAAPAGTLAAVPATVPASVVYESAFNTPANTAIVSTRQTGVNLKHLTVRRPKQTLAVNRVLNLARKTKPVSPAAGTKLNRLLASVWWSGVSSHKSTVTSQPKRKWFE